MNKEIPAKDVHRNLPKKGFRLEGTKRDHEWFVYYNELDQLTDFRVKLSHGAREMRRDEIHANARGLACKTDDLYKILSCEHDIDRTREVAADALKQRRGAR